MPSAVLRRFLPALLLAVVFAASGALAGPAPAPARDLVLIDDPAAQTPLGLADLPVLWKGAGFFIARWDASEQQRAREAGIAQRVVLHDVRDDQQFHLVELDPGELLPAGLASRVLFQDGRKLLLDLGGAEAESWIDRGLHTVRLPAEPRGWSGPTPLAFDCSYRPLVGTLLGRTDIAQWTGWIRRLSGADPVQIGGVERTIQTRHSTYLFNGATNAKAFDYLIEQLGAWHYAPAAIEQDPFTGSGGATWKNAILTIPGQTLPGEVVYFTAHFDSISPNSSTLAPGADDNGTGSAMLLEAARLLRQFRFARTIRLIWFTGEEQGLWGSEAYVADHPMTGAVGVVNIDMAGYDSNADRCFEIHAGTLPQSIDVGNCMRDSVGVYGLGLNQDFLTTTATDRSDHASFWQVNVGAIEIAENFFNDGIPGGCVGSDQNPNYHQTTDNVSFIAPSFGFDIGRAALATVAALAQPLSACFADAPTLTATPGTSSVALDWTPVASAARYRVSRSTQGCAGQWTEIADVAGTSWTDDLATEARPYSYHVEAVHPDGTCVSAMSDCDTVEPTIHRANATSFALADVCAGGGPGSGNGILEPGEDATLTVTLQNQGNTTLNAISGTLAATSPSTLVLDPSGSWNGALAPGGSSPSTPDGFALRVAPGLACGQTVTLALDLDYLEGGNATGLALPLGSTTPTLPINAPFTGGIPAGWTVIDGGTGGALAPTWTTSNPGARTIAAPFAAPFAIVDSDRAGSAATQDEQLITPTLDLAGCTTAVLRFDNQFRWYSGGQAERGDVDVSTDGGTNWSNVLRLQGASDGYTTPNTKTVDLTAAIAANPANVKVRFHYYQAQFEWWWAIDNVRVECSAPTCNACTGPSGPPGAPAAPLLLGRDGSEFVLTWGQTPGTCGVVNYAVYRGDLGALRTSGYAHDTALTCAAGAASLRLAGTDPRLGDADYFLVVAVGAGSEGSYGLASGAVERPASAARCRAVLDLSACAP